MSPSSISTTPTAPRSRCHFARRAPAAHYSPDQIVFDPVNLNIYVRASGTPTDIFQITLTDRGARPAHGRPATTSTPHCPCSRRRKPSAWRYTARAAARASPAGPASKSLIIIDPSTSHTLTIADPIPTDVIIPFTSQPDRDRHAENASHARRRALGSTSVLFADLRAGRDHGRTVHHRLRPCAPPPAMSGPWSIKGIVVLVAGQASAIARFTVVDLATRRFVGHHGQQHVRQPLPREPAIRAACGAWLPEPSSATSIWWRARTRPA